MTEKQKKTRAEKISVAACHGDALCVHKIRRYGQHFHTRSNYFLHSAPLSKLELGTREDEVIHRGGGGGESLHIFTQSSSNTDRAFFSRQ